MKIVVYSVMEIERPFYEGLAEELGMELSLHEEDPTVETAELAKGADAVCVITTHVDAEVLTRFHELGIRYLSTRNIGYDHIDMEKARELGLGVGNSSYSPNNVSEYAMMLMLMATRKGAVIYDAYKRQDYSLDGKMGALLNALTVGVVGTGKIGTTLIHTLKGFGCKILAMDPFPNEEAGEGATYVDMDTLLSRSDIITLHAPATPENHHLIDEAAIAKMKDGVILINTARGALIDTKALIKSLTEGKFGYVALDVLEGETPIYYKDFQGQPVPHAYIDALSAFPNVLLTPHTAFYTRNAFFEMVQNAIRSCALELTGQENPWRIV